MRLHKLLDNANASGLLAEAEAEAARLRAELPAGGCQAVSTVALTHLAELTARSVCARKAGPRPGFIAAAASKAGPRPGLSAVHECHVAMFTAAGSPR